MDITGNTRLVGILGDPIAHTLSPLMQNAAFRAMGLDICYVPLHVKAGDLPAAVEGLRAMSFVGANVTIPHKVAAADLMDNLAESAAVTGAVNTIVSAEGVLTGHNTDGPGFIKSLEEIADLDYGASPVLMAGAGGAARSVAVALASKGVPRLTIVNRTRSTAENLKSLLEDKFPSLQVFLMGPDEDQSGVLAASKLVINATPLGMEGALKRPPLVVDKLSKEHVVCDLVYTKSQETPLLVAAKEKGATILGGLGMLIHQGAAAIHLWTGVQPPIEIMKRAIESQ